MSLASFGRRSKAFSQSIVAVVQVVIAIERSGYRWRVATFMTLFSASLNLEWPFGSRAFCGIASGEF